MKLRALIERLEEIENDLLSALGDDCEPEVFCAIQPSYPLAVDIDGVAPPDEDDAVLYEGRPVVWIATAGHPEGISPYAPRSAFEGAI